MQLYKNNLIEDATLTASTEVTGSEVEKIKTRQIADKFYFGVTGGNIVVDLGSSENITNIFIGGLEGTWTVEANATDAWTSPSYTHSLDSENSTSWLILNETYRYWRFVTTDDIGMGILTLTNEVLQLPGVDQGSEIFYHTSSEATKNIGGQIFSNQGYQFIQTQFDFPQIGENNQTINGVVCASRKEIISYWKEVQNIIPFWCIIWEGSLDEYEPFLGVFKDNNIRFKKLNYPGYYSTSLMIEEVL